MDSMLLALQELKDKQDAESVFSTTWRLDKNWLYVVAKIRPTHFYQGP